MPPSLQGIMSVFHDELSKRSTNCMPSDFEDRSHEPELWGTPQPFDRTEGYDKNWVNYDKVDIFGEPLSGQAKM